MASESSSESSTENDPNHVNVELIQLNELNVTQEPIRPRSLGPRSTSEFQKSVFPLKVFFSGLLMPFFDIATDFYLAYILYQVKNDFAHALICLAIIYLPSVVANLTLFENFRDKWKTKTCRYAGEFYDYTL